MCQRTELLLLLNQVEKQESGKVEEMVLQTQTEVENGKDKL